LQKYFTQIEADIQADPLSGSKETIVLGNSGHLPLRVYSVATDLFSGNVPCYSRMLTVAYLYTPMNGGAIVVYQYYLD
jgi:hypothetical protein